MALLGYLGREIKNEGNLKEYLEVDSKLGGYPDFLTREIKVNCEKCSLPLKFILQLNTPYSIVKRRVIYLFYCENNYCSMNWTTFRSSVESNLHNATESFPNKESSILTDDWLQSAGIDINTSVTNQNIQNDSKIIENLFSRKLDQKSYLIKYISESDVDNGDIKIKFLLDSYISNADNDPIEIEKCSDSDVSSDKSDNEYLDPSNAEESCYIFDKDRYLHNFSSEISKFPRQIIRYCFGGTPLYSESPKKINIPTCKECGSNKVFEFQIISSIIYEWENLFGEKDIFCKCSSEWSTIIIYTCSKDCNTEFSEETAIIQYFI
ncbi:Programmed cell death protein 2 C-terminal domain containing protein [Cryptosporidium parvum]|uniref:Programmed cell death protein 2 C-terminal domain-containing protein n=1 Tax=Cryptosporidium parvum TaxID=5807 RepID=A0A7S7RGR7_CRYPV|nr:Programmed cell death protein 2 C-terminal domain containing protein [Cryptosporidium parvum]WRK31851.1 Programmed cell death protein 2 C-terminal domain containing protein [Cryptosporidium parvum]|eukprot:QOY42174.1 hypothetical protein CPATCC_001787 [Cryptosporidium parvum]